LSKERYRLYEGVGVPAKNPGPASKYADLPLDTIAVGDLVEMPMGEEEVGSMINGVRAYVGRIQRKTDKKYSVRVVEYGIGIWRIQ